MLALAVATSALAAWSIREVLLRTGGVPAVALDDAYIHFQYARAFAEGRPLGYSPGALPCPGASSLLYSGILGVFHALGFEGSALVWPAWALGWASLGLLGWEVFEAGRELLEERTRHVAVVALLCMGGFSWCAGSGMEVIPLAWLLLRTARRSAEWLEEGAAPTAPRVPSPQVAFRELVGLAVAGPLLRPEGALATIMVAAALLLRPRSRRRWWGAAVLSAIALPPLINLGFTGAPASTTLAAKWLFARPYPNEVVDRIVENMGILFQVLMAGDEWARYLVPEGPAFVAWLSLPALLLLGHRRGRMYRGAMLAVVGLGILIPTTYHSFLWNRLRYLWPFVPVWLMGVVALGDVVSEFGARFWSKLRGWGFLAGLVVAGASARTLPATILDLAESSDAILRQQADLGRWARRAVPVGKTIGVNDAGAIAYFSEHRVFDFVGLTTLGEARYWAAGAGSRFEHYEELGAAKLPEYLIVYPGWWQMPELLGRQLTERTVYATILGGYTMVAHEADWSLLGSAPSPLRFAPVGTEPVAIMDELDVAHLKQEAQHRYSLFDAKQAENVLVVEQGRADGARMNRTIEEFDLLVGPKAVLVMRFGTDSPANIELTVSGQSQHALVDAGGWHEVEFAVPDDISTAKTRMTVRSDLPFHSMHYWSIRQDAPHAGRPAPMR